ncbi:hypothetical protein [Nostoc sp.]|uniref:hypothetical protein n=1 Tax=Nostoc sp. TaxID=1180 RepID=UPI002FF48E5E
MNVNYSKNLLLMLAGLVGVASTGALISLPVHALQKTISSTGETNHAPIGNRLYSQAGGATDGSNTGTQQYPNNGTTGTQQYPNNGTTGTQQYPNNGTTGTQTNTTDDNTTGGQNTNGGVRALW